MHIILFKIPAFELTFWQNATLKPRFTGSFNLLGLNYIPRKQALYVNQRKNVPRFTVFLDLPGLP